MPRESLRRAFVAFHITLGLALLYLSVRTVLHGLGTGTDVHEVLIGSIEALGALLFLVPRTLRAGGTLLLLTIGIAFLVHAITGHVRADLLIYAAGAWFVMVHGPAYSAA